MSMSITETLRLQTLERELVDTRRQNSDLAARVEALEAHSAAQAERIGELEAQRAARGQAFARVAPEPLKRGNECRVADAARLREEIRQILERLGGPRRGIAKLVQSALAETDIGRSEQPSLRAVQWHITQLRKTAGVAQKAVCNSAAPE